MICSLIIGRKGSQGFPGKNLHKIFNKPIAWYPMNAANNTAEVDKNFMSTDDPKLAELARTMGFDVIERPEYLATPEALGEDAYKHGFEEISKRLGLIPDLLVLLFCNAPTVTSKQIRQGILLLENNQDADSAVTVSRYNMFSPTRARRISDDGTLQPFIPFESHPNPQSVNCDRDSQGDVWFADVALSVIRPKNFETLDEGLLPQKWMGKKILPILNEAGLDIDFEWQLGQLEWWIENNL